MKKLYLLLGILLMVSMPLWAERVDSETARKVATTFLNNNGAKSVQLNDLSKEAGFSNLYIFNAAQGFVVMAADDCVQPILGYSLTGRFVANKMPTNISGWLQGYNDEIQYAIDNQMKADDETAKLWKDLINGDSKAGKTTIVVDAMIQSTWDQDPGYNDLCPYDSDAGELTVTGCVATAMAQIMRYWEYPSHGSSYHSYTPSNNAAFGTQSVNYANATYDWTDMPLHSSNAEIAKLMYHCGVSVDMMYGVGANGGSGAYPNDIPYALTTYFNYKYGATFKSKSSYSSNNWNNLIKTELNNGRPVEYNGTGTGGHAFVCDGYDNSDYFHINWGWSGSNDGFYTLSNLVPGSGGSGGGNYSFNENQSAVFGIQPKDCLASTPTNLKVITENRSALLTWNSASNAESYSIYRNGLLIANTTSTSYTDNNLSYGNYDYFIKSRDTNGAASKPSVTETATIEPVASNLTIAQNGNGAKFNWTAPEWCVPQNDDEVLTYGDGSIYSAFGGGPNSTTKYYFGHRYQKTMLSANKALYKVSFYATMAGSFKLCIYTSDGGVKPQTLARSQSFTVSTTGWNDVILSTPYQINTSKDLWVFIYDPEAKAYPIGIGQYTESEEGSYYASNPTSTVYTQSGSVMLIKTYITDYAFNYNLYDGNTAVAKYISGTSYTLSSIADNTAHQYTLKTNFNGGVTTASNLAGLTLGTATVSSLKLDANNKMTVAENSVLSVSGNLSNSVADNLVLENGAQLIHNSDNVAATVKRAITSYTSNDDGWYTIATPFNTFDPTPFTTNSYDLYAYDEDGEQEWINYKTHQTDFPLNVYSGYLYAHKPNVTVSMTGILNNGSYSQEVNLSYASSNENIKGFNLLGNPTAHEITFTKTESVSDGYYYLNNSGTWVYEASNTVPAGRGFLVKANADGQTVTINPGTKSGNDDGETQNIASLQIDVDGNKAYVNMNKGVSMPLIDFRGHTSSVYLTRDGKSYIMLVNDDAQSVDLSYKPQFAGQHQFTVTLDGIDIEYLHLIDHLTGADIDLLQNPSYSFESTTDDYASRFKLVFDESSIGNLTGYNNLFVDGKSQILDITGRVVATDRNTKLAPGIYILRTINENETNSQKIIIK